MRLRQKWQNIRSSFWFLPAVLVLFAIILAMALIEAGGYVGDDAMRRWPRVFGAGASGARGLLTTVATSMITVAGVVFSITIVALSLA